MVLQLKTIVIVFQVHAKDDTHTAKHTISHAEQKGYAGWMNRSLAKDEDCREYLPINGDHPDEIYEKCKDGILICKLINKWDTAIFEIRKIVQWMLCLEIVFNVLVPYTLLRIFFTCNCKIVQLLHFGEQTKKEVKVLVEVNLEARFQLFLGLPSKASSFRY